jgi:hypothetical protein
MFAGTSHWFVHSVKYGNILLTQTILMNKNQLSPDCLPQSGAPIEYLSSAKGWVAAAFVAESENEDSSRCLIRIGDSEALSQVSLRSLRLPQ